MKNGYVTLLVGGITFAILLIQRMRGRRGTALPAPPPEPFRMPPPDPSVFMLRGMEFYVRLEGSRREEMLEAVRAASGSDGTVYDEKNHAVVLWHGFHPPAALLERVSRELKTEVIWLAFQKQVDAFGYERWVNGVRQRRLTFGCFEQERTWEEVDGAAEAWEAAAIFDDARLDFRFATNAKLGPEMRIPDDEAAELRAIWKARRLAIGATEPNINGRDVAEAVATAYGLPGWE